MKIDTDMGLVSLHLSGQNASIHVQHDLLRSPRDFGLKSNFDHDLSRSYYVYKSICIEEKNTIVSKEWLCLEWLRSYTPKTIFRKMRTFLV